MMAPGLLVGSLLIFVVPEMRRAAKVEKEQSRATIKQSAPTGSALLDISPLSRRVRCLEWMGIAVGFFFFVLPIFIVMPSVTQRLPSTAVAIAVVMLTFLGMVAVALNVSYVRFAFWAPIFLLICWIGLLIWSVTWHGLSMALVLNFTSVGAVFVAAALGARRLASLSVPELGQARFNLLQRASGGRPGPFASGRYLSTSFYFVVTAVYSALGALIGLILFAITQGLRFVFPLTPNFLNIIGSRVVRPLMYRGSRAARLRRRYASPHARRVLSKDKRRPVLLLRSFEDDELIFADEGMLEHLYRSDRTFEEALTDQLWRFGPVVAIGRPGEALPLSGAVREYLDHDKWQHRVEKLVAEASTILMILGPTPGFGWELQTVERLGAIGKVVLVIPPLSYGEIEKRWNLLMSELSLDGRVAKLARVALVPGTLCAIFSNDQLSILRSDRRRLRDYMLAIELGARTVLAAEIPENSPENEAKRTAA